MNLHLLHQDTTTIDSGCLIFRVDDNLFVTRKMDDDDAVGDGRPGTVVTACRHEENISISLNACLYLFLGKFAIR